jgi:hypothetical protein
MGTADASPEVKRQGREANRSPPTSAEIKIFATIIHSSLLPRKLVFDL